MPSGHGTLSLEDASVAQATATATLNLGFLTVLQEAAGYLGGYLVTNNWGRPREFRLSSTVQPNRIQQILYGGTLRSYICADLIGKTLVEKTGLPVQLVLTDCEAALDLRVRLEVPVIWLAPPNDPVAATLAASGARVRPAGDEHGPVLCHPNYVADVPSIRDLLNQLEGTLDLAEPFTRIREAMSEARKLGVTARG
jgi:hypothetical protein